MADRVGKLNVYAAGAVATGIVTFRMNEAKSNAALIAYSIVWVQVRDHYLGGVGDLHRLHSRSARRGHLPGKGMAIGAVGGLIGPPLDGVLVNDYGDFFQAAMYAGAVCLFGGSIAFVGKHWTGSLDAYKKIRTGGPT